MAERYVGDTALNELVKYIKPEKIRTNVEPGANIKREVLEKIIDYTFTGRNFIVQFSPASNTFKLMRPICVYDFYQGSGNAKNDQAKVTFCDGDTIYVYKLGSAADCICTTFKIDPMTAISATDVSSKF